MLDLAKQMEDARIINEEGVEYVAEFPFTYEVKGKGNEVTEKPWRIYATNPDSPSVMQRVRKLVKIYKQGKHRFAKAGKLKPEDSICADDLVRIQCEAFLDRAVLSLEFGWNAEDGAKVFSARKNEPAFQKVREELITALWLTKIDLIGDLLTSAMNHVRNFEGEEAKDTKKD